MIDVEPKIDKDDIYTQTQLPLLEAVIDGIIHSKVVRLQKELLRGDINIAEFVSLVEGLDCPTDFVEDKLDHVRLSMMEYFGLDMDEERI